MSRNNFTPPPGACHVSAPHFEEPITAPRPHKLSPEVPVNMARSLDQELTANRAQSGYNYAYNPAPGFAASSMDRPLSALPSPRGSDWSPWHSPSPAPQQQAYRSPAHNTTLNDIAYYNNTSPGYSPPADQMGPTSPSLTASLPNIFTLTDAIPSMQNPTFDPARKSSSDGPSGPIHIEDPQLLRLTQVAIPILLSISSVQPPPNPMPIYMAEAIYLVATLSASGSFPQLIPQNPRVAFREFERAAKSGYAAAWFKLGRDYESFGDDKHARQCFERGGKSGVENCLYRMGMAHLMGQLGFPARPDIALPLLLRAATLATLQVAQPAYVYALLLLNEFSHVTIPPQYFAPVIPPNSTAVVEARKHLERAAYLNFSPAQYKLGHAYEFAEPPFPFDALLSVQYYSLASQQGETEADMALSKWFLCGAEGAFEKDEALAFTFAEKASRKGLPSAEFAMGYYTEVGVGGPKDIEAARKWYTRAAEHGNADASDRISALSQPAPQALSRQEHDTLTDTQLVRKRTQAKQRSDIGGRKPATSPHDGQRIIEVVRKNSHPPSRNEYQTRPAPVMATVMEDTRISYSPASIVQNSQLRSSQEYPPVHQALPANNKPFADRPRYSLVDPGTQAAAYLSAMQPINRPSSGYGHSLHTPVSGGSYDPSSSTAFLPQPTDSEAPVRPKPAKGATTFQEMGIQSAKLEDKECIIM